MGQQRWPKLANLGTVRMVGDNLVATGVFLLSELVFRELDWDGQRYIDNDARDARRGISESTVTIGTVHLPDPIGPGGGWGGRRCRGCVRVRSRWRQRRRHQRRHLHCLSPIRRFVAVVQHRPDCWTVCKRFRTV
jgi:hypothetical protein